MYGCIEFFFSYSNKKFSNKIWIFELSCFLIILQNGSTHKDGICILCTFISLSRYPKIFSASAIMTLQSRIMFSTNFLTFLYANDNIFTFLPKLFKFMEIIKNFVIVFSRISEFKKRNFSSDKNFVICHKISWDLGLKYFVSVEVSSLLISFLDVWKQATQWNHLF